MTPLGRARPARREPFAERRRAARARRRGAAARAARRARTRAPPGRAAAARSRASSFADVQVGERRGCVAGAPRRGAAPFAANRPLARAAARAAQRRAGRPRQHGLRRRSRSAAPAGASSCRARPTAARAGRRRCGSRRPRRGEDQWWPASPPAPAGSCWVAWQQGERVVARALHRRRPALPRARASPGEAARGGPPSRRRPRARGPGVGRGGRALRGRAVAPAVRPPRRAVRDGQVGASRRLDGPRRLRWPPRSTTPGRRRSPPAATGCSSPGSTSAYDWDVRAAVGRRRRDLGARAGVNDTPPALEALDDRPQAALGRGGRWSPGRTGARVPEPRSARAACTTPSSGAPASRRPGRRGGRRPPLDVLARPRGAGRRRRRRRLAGPHGGSRGRPCRARGSRRTPRPGAARGRRGRAGWNQWRPALALVAARAGRLGGRARRSGRALRTAPGRRRLP